MLRATRARVSVSASACVRRVYIWRLSFRRAAACQHVDSFRSFVSRALHPPPGAAAADPPGKGRRDGRRA
eukprot:13373024-Alexandrium_andersonii.AAC.1